MVQKNKAALALPLRLKLAQHGRQAAIAGNSSIMPGLPGLSRIEPFLRSRPKHQVCRFQNDLVASIPLPIREPRAEHSEQRRARLQKLLRRIALHLQVLTVVNLPGQCVQQIGQRPVSARSHGGSDLLPLPMRRRPLGQYQVLNVSALSKSARLSLGAEPQLRMRRIRILTHAPQCSASHSPHFHRS